MRIEFLRMQLVLIWKLKQIKKTTTPAMLLQIENKYMSDNKHKYQ